MRQQIKNEGKRKLSLNKKAIALLNLNEQQARLIVGGDKTTFGYTDTFFTIVSSVKHCTTLTQLPTD